MESIKVWAFAKDENDNYILKKNGSGKQYFHVKNVIKQRTYNPDEYKKLSFWCIDTGDQLTPVQSENGTQFFRYLKSINIAEKNSNGETKTHLYIKQYLSLQKTIPFRFKGESYVNWFNVINIKVEHEARFQFGESDYFLPDLYIYFDNPEYYRKKWDGKAVIEIKVSNKIDDQKRVYFETHNIPIIEINIPEYLYFGYKEDTEENKIKYFDRLKKAWTNYIDAEIKTNHVEMPLYRYEKHMQVKRKITELENSLLAAQKENTQLKQWQMEYKAFFEKEYPPLLEQNRALLQKINKIENRTFLQKLKYLFFNS